MKISDVRTVIVGNPWKNWIFVVVETDDGLIGVGEATGGSETQPRVAAIQEIKPLVIGMDPRNVHEIFQGDHFALDCITHMFIRYYKIYGPTY